MISGSVPLPLQLLSLIPALIWSAVITSTHVPFSTAKFVISVAVNKSSALYLASAMI